MHGLECIYNSTEARERIVEWEKETVLAKLKGEELPKKPSPIPLNQMLLRARLNSQRCYEIYEFASTLSIDGIKSAFSTAPQQIVEWIRTHGYKIHSDYSDNSSRMIR